MTARGLRRHLDDLVAGRRPRPFRASEADADELRVALELRATRPDADAPREGFVAELHRRLAAELDAPPAATTATETTATETTATETTTAETTTAETTTPEPVRLRTGSLGRRRLLVQGAGLAAASAAAGATVGHLLSRETAPGQQELDPTTGTWQTVAASTDLPDGLVRAFDLGSTAGFVHRAGGVPQAVSGTCTHLGCHLRLAPAGMLACPCHTTVFAASGEVVTHQLPNAPRPLPRFATREVDGAVQVYAPPPTV
ncbi:MAG: Rieske 2Fe-2S domain-containing protein [Pseudonocardia sp.]|nr:Rieske 2Fe-2S domain-containing protein [Pseudonocardia sp.]